MTDREKIREEIARLKEKTSIGLSEHENGVEQGRMEIINALSLFLDSLQEEPVSEDLNKEIQIWQDYYGGTDGIKKELIKQVARHFAEWQKKQDNNHGYYSEYQRGYEAGMKEAKRQMMKDLPRWKKAPAYKHFVGLYDTAEGERRTAIVNKGYVIGLEELEKLPKED